MKCTIHYGHHCPADTDLCVVIDVIRAFTTAAYAFAAGAEKITFVQTPEQAFDMRAQLPETVLMGESEGLYIEGFDYQNSPLEISRAPVKGKHLVQRTSSGTQGVIGSKHAPHILVSSFVVAQATLDKIVQLAPSSLCFVVTGRKNGDEDAALAEYLKASLEGEHPPLSPYLQRVRNSLAAQRMLSGKASYSHAADDLEMILQANCFSFAMEVRQENGQLTGYTE